MMMRYRNCFVLCSVVLALFLVCGCEQAESIPTVVPLAEPTVVELTAMPTAVGTATRELTRTPVPTHTPIPTPTAFVTRPAGGEDVLIPILMYHHLELLPANASETLRTWTVAPEQFAAQLDYLQERGFHTITFKQLVEFFDEGAPLPTKPALLTFDDGWIDDYTVAFPELAKRGMVGNFFPPTQYVDAGGKLLMDWDQVLEMDRAGMEFGGHTVSHADLTKINLHEVRRQLTVSKAKMEEKLGHTTYAFSYPFGSFNPKIVAETQAAGYRAGLILCCGYKLNADILLTLPRIRVSYGDTVEEIAHKLP